MTSPDPVGERSSAAETVIVVSQRVPTHPCPLPRGRRARKRLGIEVGTVVECPGCRQRWEWNAIGMDFANEWLRVPDGQDRR